MEIMVMIYLFSIFVACFILYYLIKSAVKEGTLEALIQYERIRSKENKED